MKFLSRNFPAQLDSAIPGYALGFLFRAMDKSDLSKIASGGRLPQEQPAVKG